MPVNVGLTFLIGGILGWIAAKILKPDRHLEALLIACCSAGNLGTMPLIIVPAICDQDGNPFGDSATCHSQGLSYVSFSMALGNFFIWTHTYSLIKKSIGQSSRITQNAEVNRDEQDYDDKEALLLPPSDGISDEQTEIERAEKLKDMIVSTWEKTKETVHRVAKELLQPPNTAAVFGFAVGTVPWLKSLIVGEAAPLKVVQDCMVLLGNAAVPSTIIILGGNLTEGLRKSTLKPLVIAAIICVRYVMLPLFGILVVTAAGHLGFLPRSPLYRYVLLIQYTVPPAMSIGTMTQLFEACKEECSVLFLWTYAVAALALTIWSMVFISIVG
ncbi:protein PIN-LIKES 7-like [Canna indica]|uniref:Protein PIN-LIKES 7-like n=1 Tax=Canna indica TaxID=4628 RepID=A0AAQ3KED1_9LILI|nr:protein PIN-LIKES 7-like [Canna indica]